MAVAREARREDLSQDNLTRLDVVKLISGENMHFLMFIATTTIKYVIFPNVVALLLFSFIWPVVLNFEAARLSFHGIRLYFLICRH